MRGARRERVGRATHPAVRRGFSLLDAIAAIVILAVATPAMLMALASAHRDRVTPVMASHARWLAAERLEDILADRASPERGWEYVVDANYSAEEPVAGMPGYTRTVAILETGPDLVGAGEGYKSVTVRVEWVGTDGETDAVELATVVTELPS